jgi:hypothetical protein
VSYKLIRVDVLEQALARRSESFATRDVSEDEQVMEAHRLLTSHRNYHAFVGRALSKQRGHLGIVEVRGSTARGSSWQKLLRVDPLKPDNPSATAIAGSNAEMPVRLEMARQHSKGVSFKARMRAHQSRYRAEVMQLACGTGPTRTSTTRLGNMLTRADGAAGRNFVTSEIAEVARARVAEGGGGVEAFRLLHNMLSSQPMCFNLFGPLLLDRALAARLLRGFVAEGVSEVTRVAIEWAPKPASGYLADKTSFDAFIEYRAADGSLRALGIETKLTDSFSRKMCDGEPYRRWMRVPEAPWRADAADRVQAVEHNQIWRNHLLALALRHQPASPYAGARSWVVHHPGDDECVRVCEGYRALLRDDADSFDAISLDRIVDAWSAMVEEPAQAAWLRSFRARYLDLVLSRA